VADAAAAIRAVLFAAGSRQEKACAVAESIRSIGPHRWVGLYDVDAQFVTIIAFSGPGAPAFPAFPVTKGLTSAAIRDKAPLIVSDVRNDPRYLTAFGSTLSEIIIPVLNPVDGRVIGTVDVESERANAFGAADSERLQCLAGAALPLWTSLQS